MDQLVKLHRDTLVAQKINSPKMREMIARFNAELDRQLEELFKPLGLRENDDVSTTGAGTAADATAENRSVSGSGNDQR